MFESYGPKRGPLHGLLVSTPYVTKDHLQLKRFQAQSSGTTYVYDYPEMFRQVNTHVQDSLVAPPASTTTQTYSDRYIPLRRTGTYPCIGLPTANTYVYNHPEMFRQVNTHARDYP